MSVSVVLPTYEESRNVLEIIRRLERVLAAEDYEIIVVDDDSPDGTWRLAEDYSRDHPRVKSVRRITDRGLSSAILEGFRRAKGEYLAVMDADLSHDESILPAMLAAARGGAELVAGSRRIPGGGAENWPCLRRFISSSATRLAQALLRPRLSDPMSGYFLIRRGVYERVRDRLRPRGYKILLELAMRARPVQIAEVPFVFRDRRAGYSKLSAFVALTYLESLFELRFGLSPLDRLRELYHRGRYAKVRAWLKPGELLDVGCGRPCDSMPDGAFLREAGRGVGLDIKQCDGGFPFKQGRLEAMPFGDREFDNVVAMEVLEHVDDLDAALREVRRVLKDDGRFVISVPDDNLGWKLIWWLWTKLVGRMWRHTHHVQLRLGDWRRRLARDFEVLAVRRHWYFDAMFLAKKK